MKKKWDLTKCGKHIGIACCGASIANVFVNSDLVQDIIWCVLAVAMLFVILDDGKQFRKVAGYYSDALQRIMILTTLPDEITERLEEAEFCDEDLKEQFNAIVWESYFEVMRKSDEFRPECDVAQGRNREAEKDKGAEHISDQDISKIS